MKNLIFSQDNSIEKLKEYIDNFEIPNFESPDLLRKVVIEKQKQE